VTCATNFSHNEGWRLIFVTIGGLSLLLAAAVAVAMTEPPRVSRSEGPCCSAATLATFRAVLTIPSFRLIVAQGVCGSIPWSAIGGFGILWLQYAGVSNADASLAVSLFFVANALGVLASGWIGDWAARCSPDTGRARVAQLSVLNGLVVMGLLYLVVPPGASSLPSYIVLYVLLGLTASWCLAGVNQPILSEIVPPHMRATAMATEFGLETASSGILGGPLVGFLAQHVFGYEVSSVDIDATDAALRASNESALRSALSWLVLLPWTVCLLFYLALTYTYPSDRDRARALAAGTE